MRGIAPEAPFRETGLSQAPQSFSEASIERWLHSPFAMACLFALVKDIGAVAVRGCVGLRPCTRGPNIVGGACEMSLSAAEC